MARRKKPRQNDASQLWIAPLIVVLLGLVAYSNSFWGVYLFDDFLSVRDNPDFGAAAANSDPMSPHYVGGAVESTTVSGRPVLWLTFWLESKLTDRSLGIEHATNLVIHLGCGLLLYGIVRRNLMRREYWGDPFQTSGPWVAAAAASIWVVHPVNTEAVTYIVQRAESLAGLFYLAVIYCVIRAAEDKRESSTWRWAAVTACLLGVAAKEVVATAPVVAFIYDRTFLAGSFAGAWRARWKMYAGMLGSWVLFAGLVVTGGGRGGTVGFAQGMTPLDYARTQLGVIAHYLRLVVWPVGLSIEYDWPIARGWGQILWTGWLMAGLVIVWLVAMRKKPLAGFLGAWVFLILAPSSSFVPIVTEIVSEHRMYLPLAALVAFGVVGGWIILSRWRLEYVGIGAAGLVAVGFIVLTLLRNMDYHSAQRMWAKVVAKQPNNALAHYNYAYSMAEIDWSLPRGSAAQKAAARDAADHLTRVLEILPDSATRYSSSQLLGHMLMEAGDPAGAEAVYDAILVRKTAYDSTADAQKEKVLLDWESHQLRGQLRGQRRDFEGAKEDFQAALVTRPDFPQTHFLLGVTLESLNDIAGARAEFQRTLQLDDSQDVTYRNAQRELEKLEHFHMPSSASNRDAIS